MINIKKWMIRLIIFTIPIMSIININESAKFNFSMADFFIIAFMLAYFIDWKNINLKEDFKINIYFCVFIAVIIVSNMVNGVSMLTTVSELIKAAILAAYLFIGYLIPKYKITLRDILHVWLLGTWLNILLGSYIQFNAFIGKTINLNTVLSPRTRFMGLLTDANLAATYLTISFFIALIYYQLHGDKKNRIFAGLTMIFTAAGIILTQSRGGMIGFSVGVLLYAALNYKKINIRVLYVVPIVIVLYVGILDVDYTFFDAAFSNSITQRIELAAQGQDQFLIRKNLSLASIQMGMDHPILGVGRGNFVNNSKPYIDKLYDKRDDYIYRESIRHIPHNTFAGIFAELGIIGLVSFSSIFYVLLRRWYRSDNPLRNIIFVMSIAFFVQSLVLSLENFRGLWLLIGIFLQFADEKVNVYEGEQRLIWKKTVFVYIGVIFLLIGILYLDLGRKVQNEIILSQTPYTVVIENRDLQKITVQYYIDTKSDNPGNISMIINVYEYKNGVESIIQTIDYWKAQGIGSIELDGQAEQYMLEFMGTENNNTKATIQEIRYEDSEGKRYPLSDYKYIPDFIAKYFGQHNLLSYRDIQFKKEDIKQGNNIAIDDKLLYLDHGIEEKDGVAYITVRFKALKDIKYDYYFNITAKNNNINNSPNFVGGYNTFNLPMPIEPKTSTWRMGEIYEYKIPFKGEEAEYDLSFNLQHTEDSTISKTKIGLGKVKTNSYKLADFLNNIQDNQLVLLSVKDEGFRSLDRQTLDALKNLGLRMDTRGKTRYSYIGIGGKIQGLVSYEKLQWEKINTKIDKSEKLGSYVLPFDLELVSAGYMQGNASSIKINGKEYSQNRRGLNIVVYDLDKNEVIESTNFDTYMSIFK